MDRLRASQMLVAPRLCVFAELPLSDAAEGPNTCLIMLELDGKDVTPIWRANAFWTSRRPRGPCLDIAMLQSWRDTAREMDKGHESLSESDEVSLQELISQGCFRVLDVVTKQVVVLSKIERFLAVSYVWGKTDFAAMIKHDIRVATPRSDGLEVCWTLDVGKTPNTIRDAMSIAQRLGERYLWVDSICINQESWEDKATVIREMRAIYRSASLTIVAAEGENADAGLRRLARQDKSEQPLVIRQGDRSLHLYPALPSLEDTIKATPWNERGWTYQERVLSSACVYFTRDEVLFSSGGIIEREAYVITNNPDRPLHTYRRKTPSIGKQATLQGALSRPIIALSHKVHRYQEAVIEFTRRKLTHDGDRLDAITGILALLKDRDHTEKDVQALSGLLQASAVTPHRHPGIKPSSPRNPVPTRMESSFISSLLWQPRTPLTKDQRIRHNTTNSRALPSWSWVGWACEVHYRTRPNQVSDLASAVVLNENNIQLTVSSDEPFPPWPYEPPLSDISVRDAFVLHMWRPILRGKLELYSSTDIHDFRGWRTYVIMVPEARESNQRLCLIDVANEVTNSHAEGQLYDFVPVDYGGPTFSPRNLLMVRHDGEFYERVALSYGTPFWMEHVRSIECQHIKLI